MWAIDDLLIQEHLALRALICEINGQMSDFENIHLDGVLDQENHFIARGGVIPADTMSNCADILWGEDETRRGAGVACHGGGDVVMVV